MAITTDRDKVRLLIGDTNTDEPLLYDDELDVFLELHPGDLHLAAADACAAIAAKFARGYDITTDGQSLSRSQRVKQYMDMASSLRNQAPGALSVIPVTRVDGYSEDIDTREGGGANSRTGRVRAGYYDNDMPV